MNGSEHDNRKIGNEVPDTDLALLESVLGGDNRAFDDLVRRHERRVYRTTIAVTGNSEEAEEAIRSLPPVYRVAFVLRDLEELTTAKAAEILGLTIPAMKTRLMRARLMVREALARHFESPVSLKKRLLRGGMMLRAAIGERFSKPGHAKSGD